MNRSYVKKLAFILALPLVCLFSLAGSASAAWPIGDLNQDHTVNLEDLQIFVGQWLDLPGCVGHPTDCADIIGNDGVAMPDFALLAGSWLKVVPTPIITEFMADNETTLSTIYEPGGPEHFPDWMEIHNPDNKNSLDLENWYLTDTKSNLSQWSFPAGVVIGPGGYMVVFASGQDFIDPAGYYHTNFQLNRDGEYLAVVRPDGTIAHEYNPMFPLQSEDISFGLGAAVITETTLVGTGAEVSVLVPQDGSLGTTWTETTFVVKSSSVS